MLLNVAGVLHEVGSSGAQAAEPIVPVRCKECSRPMRWAHPGDPVAPQFGKKARIGNVSARVGSISDNRLDGGHLAASGLNGGDMNMALG